MKLLSGGDLYGAIASILCTNYDAFKDIPFGGKGGSYEGIKDVSTDAFLGIFHISERFGIYAGAIALIVAAILIMWNSQNTQKRAEGKSYLLYVLVIIMCIAGTTGIVVGVAKIFL